MRAVLGKDPGRRLGCWDWRRVRLWWWCFYWSPTIRGSWWQSACWIWTGGFGWCIHRWDLPWEWCSFSVRRWWLVLPSWWNPDSSWRLGGEEVQTLIYIFNKCIFYNLLLDKMSFTKVIKAPNAQQYIGSFVACCQ